jgi:hypothetical protein
MLPKTADESLLEALFAPYGKIKEIHIIRTAEVRAVGGVGCGDMLERGLPPTTL